MFAHNAVSRRKGTLLGFSATHHIKQNFELEGGLSEAARHRERPKVTRQKFSVTREFNSSMSYRSRFFSSIFKKQSQYLKSAKSLMMKTFLFGILFKLKVYG